MHTDMFSLILLQLNYEFPVALFPLVTHITSWLRSYDCTSFSEATLKNMGKITRYISQTKPDESETVYLFIDVLCNAMMTQYLGKHITMTS